MAVNLGDFTKEKVINFFTFLETKFPEQARRAIEEVKPLSPIAIMVFLDHNIGPCTHAIEKRDIRELADSLSGEFFVFFQEMANEYEDTPLEDRDKFWRYLELFQKCINSKD